MFSPELNDCILTTLAVIVGHYITLHIQYSLLFNTGLHRDRIKSYGSTAVKRHENFNNTFYSVHPTVPQGLKMYCSCSAGSMSKKFKRNQTSHRYTPHKSHDLSDGIYMSSKRDCHE